MWYPNKPQWLVIWIVSALAFILFVDATPPAPYRNREIEWALALLYFGALLVWQLSKRPRPKKDPDLEHRLDMFTARLQESLTEAIRQSREPKRTPYPPGTPESERVPREPTHN